MFPVNFKMVFTALIFLISCASAQKGITVSRIVGGTPAYFDDYRYIVHIISQNTQTGDQTHCGGTIIHKKWVMSAGHCTTNPETREPEPAIHKIYAGMRKMPTAESAYVEGEEVHVHPEFSTPQAYYNDIALIKLKEELPMEKLDLTQPACAGFLDVYNHERPCNALGWGATTPDDPQPSKVLMEVDLPLVPMDKCKEKYEDKVNPDGALCAGYPEGGKDACQGDGGGPFVCDTIQAGIVSWAEGCAQPNTPGIYTDVGHYYEWIKETMGEDKPEDCIATPPTTTTVPTTEESHGSRVNVHLLCFIPVVLSFLKIYSVLS